VSFLPCVSAEQKAKLLSDCLCVLYTPENEHFGIVPLEAMAAGKPVLACKSGGPVESIIDRVTGFTCEACPKARRCLPLPCHFRLIANCPSGLCFCNGRTISKSWNGNSHGTCWTATRWEKVQQKVLRKTAVSACQRTVRQFERDQTWLQCRVCYPCRRSFIFHHVDIPERSKSVMTQIWTRGVFSVRVAVSW
jgi:hypothetical protein